MPSIAVATITYQRPETLGRLLTSLEALDPLPSAWNMTDYVVVDNDGAGSAESVVRHSRLEITYLVEAEPGVSHARNRAVDSARSLGAEWVAFIDDDEVARPEWLAQLTAAASDSTVCVVGAVNIHYPPGTPDWIPATGIFKSEPVDGSQDHGLLMAGNCLLRVAPPPVDLPLFPVEFNTTGGEDWALGRRLLDAGHTIDYAPRAITDETVVAERVNARYVVHRLLRLGNTLARTEIARHGKRRLTTRVRAVAEGFGRVGYGIFRGLIGLREGAPGVAAGLRTSVIGLGQISGALGIDVHGYRQAVEQ